MNWESRPILVAEDDDNDFFLLDRAVKKAAVRNPLQRVVNGQDVINYLSGVSPFSDRTAYPFPYLVLLDLKLPLKHGFDVLQWIRTWETTKVLLVVVHSSSQHHDDIRKAYNLGANGFVPKATSVDDLVEIVTAIRDYWLKVNHGASDVPRTLPS